VHACKEGVPFLGFRFFPERVRVLRPNRLRFERRLRRLRREWRRGRTGLARVFDYMRGWFQFVREFPVNEGLVRAECRHGVL
jgi:hypothetical protein